MTRSRAEVKLRQQVNSAGKFSCNKVATSASWTEDYANESVNDPRKTRDCQSDGGVSIKG